MKYQMLKAHSLDSAKNQSVDQLFTPPLLILLLLIPPHQCTHLKSSDSELISSVVLELQVLNYTQASKPDKHQLLNNNTTKCLCNKHNNNHKLKLHYSDPFSKENQQSPSVSQQFIHQSMNQSPQSILQSMNQYNQS